MSGIKRIVYDEGNAPSTLKAGHEFYVERNDGSMVKYAGNSNGEPVAVVGGGGVGGGGVEGIIEPDPLMFMVFEINGEGFDAASISVDLYLHRAPEQFLKDSISAEVVDRIPGKVEFRIFYPGGIFEEYLPLNREFSIVDNDYRPYFRYYSGDLPETRYDVGFVLDGIEFSTGELNDSGNDCLTITAASLREDDFIQLGDYFEWGWIVDPVVLLEIVEQ